MCSFLIITKTQAAEKRFFVIRWWFCLSMQLFFLYTEWIRGQEEGGFCRNCGKEKDEHDKSGAF